jgi:hypothetical protein
MGGKQGHYSESQGSRGKSCLDVIGGEFKAWEPFMTRLAQDLRSGSWIKD